MLSNFITLGLGVSPWAIPTLISLILDTFSVVAGFDP